MLQELIQWNIGAEYEGRIEGVLPLDMGSFDNKFITSEDVIELEMRGGFGVAMIIHMPSNGIRLILKWPNHRQRYPDMIRRPGPRLHASQSLL